MPVPLSINNFGPANLIDETTLTATATIGATLLNIQNASSFAVNRYIIAGLRGGESSELRQVSAVTGLQITVLATTYEHREYEQVTALFGNKIKIYRATSVGGAIPADDSYSAIATIDIDVDNLMTQYEDATGVDGQYYKAVYYNSTALTETSLSLARASVAQSNYYCSLNDIRDEAQFTNNRYITDEMIEEKRRAASAHINGALSGLFTVPFNPVPDRIEDITIRLAAGLLLLEQYGSSYAPGIKKRDDAYADIQSIKEKNSTVTDSTGTDVSLPNAGGGGFGGYPDATTEDRYGNTGADAHMFGVNRVY